MNSIARSCPADDSSENACAHAAAAAEGSAMSPAFVLEWGSIPVSDAHSKLGRVP